MDFVAALVSHTHTHTAGENPFCSPETCYFVFILFICVALS